ncbi:MAG: translation elongation factor 4 [Candidatus Dojkabacteria bacterium]|nr:translation elongation factor 4 [Candidatus Dojkabacteria bacterium]
MTDKEHLATIRNFCIIAHIDHGKSTLADRLIEFTGTMQKREIKDRVMDTLELEQERGITIKLQTARLDYKYDSSTSKTPNLEHTTQNYILNLIDTPGHVDFSYEVSRSVAASEGALLLIDASQGIQAQTLTTIYKAMEYDLKIIPVLNKVDLPNAEVERVKAEVMEAFGFTEDEIILASGKTGIGTKDILDAIVERVPAPDKENSLIYLDIPEPEREETRALIFDAFYHEYKGVIALVKVVSGEIKKKDKLYMVGVKNSIDPIEIGYLKPKMIPQENLMEGEVGYLATGLKDISKVHSGDTVTEVLPGDRQRSFKQLMGYQKPQSMVFASLYPVEASDYEDFKTALEKLSINDAALSYQKEYSQALGTGFVCGFLGLLHLEITQERLEREFDINLISTTPTVEFKVKLTTKDYSKVPYIKTSSIDAETNIATIRTAAEFPDGSLFEEVYEPWVKVEIFTPEEYIGEVMELSQKSRGVYKGMNYISKGTGSNKHAVITYEMPTVEIIVNFFDKLKSVSHGYASMDYSFLEYRAGDITKVFVLINEEEVEPLSFLAHRDMATYRGKELVSKLKDIIPKQQFKVPIQAAIGAPSNVVARETIAAYKKDVTAKLYGGDETRKKKLREKQKKGKQKLKMFGKVEIPKEAFLAALKID